MSVAALVRVGSAETGGDALVLVLTAVIAEAGHQVAVCVDEQSGRALAADGLALTARIGGDA